MNDASYQQWHKGHPERRERISRAKTKETGKPVEKAEWVTGFYASECNHESGAARAYKHEIITDETMDFCLGGWNIQEVYPETVGEYTGMKDRDGMRIFEDDYVCIEDRIYGVVEYDTNSARFVIKVFSNTHDIVLGFRDYSSSHVKVIGNRFDTPDIAQNIRI